MTRLCVVCGAAIGQGDQFASLPQGTMPFVCSTRSALPSTKQRGVRYGDD